MKVLNEVVGEQFTDPGFYTLLLGSFSVLALVLAAAGIFGLVSYATTQRTHEIGIRMALGARASDVLRLVIRQGHETGGRGDCAIGLAGAFALTRVLSTFLYQVTVTRSGTLHRVFRCCWPLWRCWLATSRRGARRKSIRWWR